MAVGYLPRTPVACILNCRVRTHVLRPKCVCGMEMSVVPGSSSSLVSTSISEAGTSSQNSPVPGSRPKMHGSASTHWSCSQAGAIHLKGRIPSTRCSHGHEFRENSTSWNDQRVARFKASATKDSRPDVSLQTDPHEPQVSYERLPPSRSGEQVDDMGVDIMEKDQNETNNHVLPEGEGLINAGTTISEDVDRPQENEKEGTSLGNSAAIGTVAGGIGLIILLGSCGAAGLFYKDQINEFLIKFSDFIEGYGPAGYGLFVLVYAFLELLAIPAIPLTMSAGLLFGAAVGTIVVSIAGTIAATGAFLIARYFARDRLLALAKGNKKFLAIDKAIGDDGFRVVTLLRLSPLLPFSLGNYLYGLTSVELGPYVLGSWLGMLPGTWAYVSAGAIGRAFIVKQESEPAFEGSPEQLWTIGLGLAATIFAATYVTRVAKDALKDID